MGPSHPASHGTVKFVIELDGETIVDIDIQVGYLHRAFEKECESGTWYQAIPYTDRLNYNSAILANLGYCMAVEKLLGIETLERCQWLRVLAGELARIADHLTRCGAACLELAAMTPFLLRHRVEGADLGPARGSVRRPRNLELHSDRRREARHAAGVFQTAAARASQRSGVCCGTSTLSSPKIGSLSIACAGPG